MSVPEIPDEHQRLLERAAEALSDAVGQAAWTSLDVTFSVPEGRSEVMLQELDVVPSSLDVEVDPDAAARCVEALGALYEACNRGWSRGVLTVKREGPGTPVSGVVSLS